jgi:hypothetical protein
MGDFVVRTRAFPVPAPASTRSGDHLDRRKLLGIEPIEMAQRACPRPVSGRRGRISCGKCKSVGQEIAAPLKRICCVQAVKV